jgi:hypothetical protein
MDELSDASAEVLTRMARREADGHLIAASAELSLRIRVTRVRCPWCRAEVEDSAFAAPPVPLFGWEFGWDWASRPHGETELRVLTCERLTARALLPMAEAVSVHEALGAAQFCTRAVALADFSPTPLDSLDVEQAIAWLDRAESWVDELRHGGAPSQLSAERRQLPLPASAHEAEAGYAASDHGVLDSLHRLRNPAAVHFLTPHLNTGLAAAMNGHYLRERLGIVATALGRPGAR